MKRAILLGFDAAVNLLLGAALLAFPTRLVVLLGIPPTDARFYPTLLGAILFGIGLALIVELRSRSERAVGLGLTGAVTINLCGGIVLAVWLLVGGLELQTRGLVFLWLLVFVLVGLSGLELLAQARGGRSDPR
ncbi:MAG: hypothetical protein PVJ43_02820 [Gemmatimonadales bacterium]